MKNKIDKADHLITSQSLIIDQNLQGHNIKEIRNYQKGSE